MGIPQFPKPLDINTTEDYHTDERLRNKLKNSTHRN